MHYLPNLRKIITRKKKEKPSRVKLHQPLDFHAHASKASSTSTATSAAPQPNQQTPLGNRLRPQLIRQRMVAAVPVPEELRHWAQDFPWRRTMYTLVALALVASICGAVLLVAWNTGAEKPICDEACSEYTMVWTRSVTCSRVGACDLLALLTFHARGFTGTLMLTSLSLIVSEKSAMKNFPRARPAIDAPKTERKLPVLHSSECEGAPVGQGRSGVGPAVIEKF
ncbi:uncharacterized protein LOC142767417 [Rhipicephalus microplus]|uniref:uncharacterized protein LOC142767417 n=1 Tax=Rhipicephalus microplus TaxID=6941 RepID=UPI003F6A589E